VLESTIHAGRHVDRGELVMPFGRLGSAVVAHRVVYRREDRGNPDIRAFIDWLSRVTAIEAQEPFESAHKS
jgi:LysR family glycine cleavage system transcriptional activator